MKQYLITLSKYFKTLIKGELINLLIQIFRISGITSTDRYLHNIKIALEAIRTNKLKSMLTALGIIFGVAAVISMLAIGRGAKHEILEQMKYIGVNNLIIEPVEKPSDGNENRTKENKGISVGLTLRDIESIMEVIPSVKYASPEIEQNTYMVYKKNRKPVKLLGVTNSYFNIYNIQIDHGSYFNSFQEKNGFPVCIISSAFKAKIFKDIDPLDQYIKCGNIWLKIIGVYQRKEATGAKMQELKISFDENCIYIPAQTMFLRCSSGIVANQNNLTQGENQFRRDIRPIDKKANRAIIRVEKSEKVYSTADLLSRMMIRRHSGERDCKVLIPELLMKQQQRAKNIFNFVLGAIAAISLLVGGIGIMNIMYASVMERIREIGIRMALGATRKDIMVQFISEAILISIIGGGIGVVLGVIISKLIMHTTGIITMVSFISLIVAFIVSVSIGVIFGFAPARRAALNNPIELLRYE